MKLSKLVDPQFQAAIKKLAAQDVPLRAAFKLRGIIKIAGEELVKYDEVRGEALKKLGDKNEDGSLVMDGNGSVQLSKENMETFVAELNSLLACDINAGVIKLSELGDKASLTTQDLIILDSLITD